MADIGLTPNSTIPAKYFEDDAPFEVRITSTKQIASPAERRLVALKIFTTAVDSKDEIRLRRELRIVQELSGRHAHIHPFFGLAIHNSSHMILVSPFMKNGDMMNYVKNQPTTPRLPLVLQVAGAVQFLHEQCRLVHGDLKCVRLHSYIHDDFPAIQSVADPAKTPATENDTPESPLHTPVRRTALDTPIAPRTQETNLLNARSLQSGRAFTIALRAGRAVRGGVLELYTGDATMPGSGKQLRVAVKLFPPSEQKEPLWTELKAAAGVRHRNVLPFFGETQFGIQMGVVARYMQNGNLLEHLRRNNLLDCRGLILQVTDAVEYLHVNEGIIHGRLKCENVLIADDGTALLCDLGLSSVLTTEPDEASFSLPRQAFQVAFSAPELLFAGEFAGASGPSRPTMPADVYAFAMLVLQAFTRSAPWGGLSNYAILSRVRKGEVPVRPDVPALSDMWWGVCVRCWSFRADARPTIKDVRRALAADAPGAEDADGW